VSLSGKKGIGTSARLRITSGQSPAAATIRHETDHQARFLGEGAEVIPFPPPGSLMDVEKDNYKKNAPKSTVSVT